MGKLNNDLKMNEESDNDNASFEAQSSDSPLTAILAVGQFSIESSAAEGGASSGNSGGDGTGKPKLEIEIFGLTAAPWSRITSTTQEVYVGDRIILRMITEPSAAIESALWTIEGNVVKDYIPGNSSTSRVELTDDDRHQTMITFEWFINRTQPYAVSAAAIVRVANTSIQLHATVNFRVVRPSVNAYQYYWREPKLTHETGEDSAIGVIASFRHDPNNEGEYCWGQTVTVVDFKWGNNGENGLGWMYQGNDGCKFPYAISAQFTDTPYLTFSAPTSLYFSSHKAFNTFLFFRHTRLGIPGIWVAIKQSPWEYNAYGHYDDAQLRWKIDYNTWVEPSVSDVAKLPAWDTCVPFPTPPNILPPTP